MANGRNVTSNPASDPRGGHVRLYWDILDSNAWRCLSKADKSAYLALQRNLRSTNNGDLSLPLSVSRQHGIASPATLAKSLRALAAVGLLAVTRKGGCTRGGKKLPTLYRFTDREVYANPTKGIEATGATNEWKSITTLGRGREAIRQVEAEAEKNQLQKLAVTTSKIGGVRAKTTSKIEVCTPSPTSKIEAGEKSKKGRKANNDAGFKKSSDFSNSGSPTSKNEVLSTTAIHRGEYGPADGPGIYRRLTAKPVGLFTSLLH
jgi:hypothetical protein